MNKKLVTLAVAAALAAPAVASADAILYGKLNVGINYIDQNEGFKGWGLSDNQVVKNAFNNYNLGITNPFITTPQGPSNRVGVKGSEDLGNGLKAIYQIELGFSISDSNNNGAVNNETITMRNTFVGLAGNFGTVLMGRHDTPLKISTAPLDLFADTLADNNNTVGFQDIRADNVVAYVSPSFSGFQFAGAVHAGGGAVAGIPLAGYNNESDSLAEAWSLAAIYKNGPWYASLAYEDINSEMASGALGYGQTGCLAPGGLVPCRLDAVNWNKWRVGLGILDWNGFTLTGIYEGWDGGMFTDGQKANLWNVQAGYTFGQIMIKAAYGSNTQTGDNRFMAGPAGSYGDISWDPTYAYDDYNFKTWTFGVDYNLSKRTKAFMLYTDNTSDDLYTNVSGSFGTDVTAPFENKWQGFQLGMMHSF